MKRFGLCLIFLIPIAYFSFLSRDYQLEDALIYERYVRNFLNGHGLVYNQGEFFNALTSPLYSYLSITASLLIGDMQKATIIISAIFTGLAALILTIVFSRYEKLPFVLFGALLMGCFPYCYSTYGLETPQFLFLLGLCLYLFEENSYFGLGIACACLILTRGEGVFLIPGMLIEHYRQKRRSPKIKYFILPAIILSANYIFNLYYYGALFPHTIAAKMYQGRSGLWGKGFCFIQVIYQFNLFFSGSVILLYSLLGLALCGALRLRLKSINVIILCFLCCYTAFYTLLNIPSYHWYYAPYYTFGFFYVGIGAANLKRQLQRFKHLVFRAASTTLLYSVMVIIIYESSCSTFQSVTKSGVHIAYRDIGLWLKDNTPNSAKIAAVEIGTLGLYSDRYIIDILGIVTPLNARFFGERRFNEWLRHYSPDYILAHDPFIGHERSVKYALAKGVLVEDKRFTYPGYKLYIAKVKQ